MAHVAVSIEGGLFTTDLLDVIAASPRAVTGQRGPDFGLETGRMSDEIQAAFSDARKHWASFQSRLGYTKESLTTVTREAWVIPLCERLGYSLKFQRAAVHVGGTSYPISHRPGEDPEAPPVHIVAWDQELDKRGEAKRSPHALVQTT